jgi:hypothetical protein
VGGLGDDEKYSDCPINDLLLAVVEASMVEKKIAAVAKV